MKLLRKLFGRGKEFGSELPEQLAQATVEMQDIAIKKEVTAEPSAISNADPIGSFIATLKMDPTLGAFNVVKALARIEDAYSMAAHVAALHCDDVKIRKAAIRAVDSIATSRYLALIKPDCRDWENDPAIQASVEVGDVRVVGVLIAALSDEEIDATTRRAAIDVLGTLGEIGDARAVEPLIAALNDEAWSVRFQAADQLVKIFKAGKLDKAHSNHILDQVPIIRSVLPPERIQNLRDNSLWPFG